MTRYSLPLYGLVAAVRFISWHLGGLLFWAGRNCVMRIAGPRVFKITTTWNSLQLELRAAPMLQCWTAVCSDTTYRIQLLLLPAPFISLSQISSFSYLKINQGCNAVGAVQILPSGAIRVWGWASARKQTASLQLQNSSSLNGSVLRVSEVETMKRHWFYCKWAQGGVKWWSYKQLAKAESRFNIVTLTMYLIDISFFCNVTICGQRRRCRFKKLIFIKCERHRY